MNYRQMIPVICVVFAAVLFSCKSETNVNTDVFFPPLFSPRPDLSEKIDHGKAENKTALDDAFKLPLPPNSNRSFARHQLIKDIHEGKVEVEIKEEKFPETIKEHLHKAAADPDYQLLEQFAFIDTNGDRLLDSDEIIEFFFRRIEELPDAPFEINEDEIKELFKDIDVDGDNKVSFREYGEKFDYHFARKLKKEL